MIFVIITVTALITIFVTYNLFKPQETARHQTMYDVDNEIRSLQGKKAVLKNVRTECENHFGTIDTLLIHEQGIYLIYYTRTDGTRIENTDKNKWIVSTKNGSEYIPNYITQSDYDIIFLTKTLDLYKHNFKVIISIGEKENFTKPVKQVKSITITKRIYLKQVLKKLLDENIQIYSEEKINKMEKLIKEASEQVQKKIYDIGIK